MNLPSASTNASLEPAGLGRRLVARLIDIVLAGAASLLAFAIAVLVASNLLEDFFNATWSQVIVSLLLILLLPLLPVLLNEIVLTARRGQTIGKRIAGIMVVRHGNSQVPTAADSTLRWLVPALASVGGGIAVAAAPVPRPQWDGFLVFLAGGFLSWSLILATSLFDSNGRGWHDKAAGTIVVAGHPSKPPEPQQPAWSWR